MYVLGISYGYVATAVLLKNGKIIAGVSEERFNSRKNYSGFPKKSIDYCLETAGIKGSDLDLVTTPYMHLPPLHMSSDHKSTYSSLSLLPKLFNVVNKFRAVYHQLRYRAPFLRFIAVPIYRVASTVFGTYYTSKQKKFIANYLKIDSSKVVSYDHHLSHAATAYYASPFNQTKTLVLTLDGEGDTYCSSVSIFNGNEFKVLAKTQREYSLGYVFGYMTKFLGMKSHEHEYKVMGLAPYAKKEDVDRVYKEIKDLVYLDPGNKLTFKMKFNAQDFDIFLDQKIRRYRFDHIAGAFQRLIEEKTSEWVLEAIKQTGVKTVVLGGGVFMNIKANQVISNLKQVEGFFVMPSCADESAPIGSSYIGHNQLNRINGTHNLIAPISDLYWGPNFKETEILPFLNKNKSKYHIQKYMNIEVQIAKLLAAGKVVANMSGRMEFGARALGNRSILANPCDSRVIKEINEQVKNRDFWMPFAPTIIEERLSDYVINPKKLWSPFMMIGFESTDLAKKELIAALHPYDLTMRPQMLRRSINPRYYKIIKEFEKITGIAGVLNTSFNLHGYPIVRGPVEAVDAFQKSGLKYLVIENYLITKI